jgi:hypothetical protein
MKFANLDCYTVNDIQERVMQAIQKEFANDNLVLNYEGGSWFPDTGTVNMRISLKINNKNNTPLINSFNRFKEGTSKVLQDLMRI